jgi:hypothetical protein
MTTPTCKCGAKLYASESGYICLECDARIVPYNELRLRPATLDIVIKDEPTEDEPTDEPCDECNGTGMVDCEHCNGDGYSECECCGSEIDCKHCDGEGQIECPTCKGEGEVNQHDLLTALDDLADRQSRINGMPSEISRLTRLAAAEIRRLQTSASTVQRHDDQTLDALVDLVRGEMETGL